MIYASQPAYRVLVLTQWMDRGETEANIVRARESFEAVRHI
jgi:hypothetical protein